MLKKTVREFNVKNVSADKAYLSRNNLEITVNLNAMPYIPFKENSVPNAKGCMLWAKLYKYFNQNKQEFMERDHRRSNVETTFSMIKQKFGSDLKTKTFQGQTNEVLAKVVCHNICVLIQEYHESNIESHYPTKVLRKRKISIQV